ncbi:Polysaccharide deacetylase [Thiothrix caldifontis]|jgi:Predicted xylanase/chitin deacetylase|uniref:Polysaccharide deacetylase n=1 Tax=Thiothrix caldifontis TaxID=525918 RepID=A0A1H4B1M3_9GAMM|nr:polysaccharide deacetylase family protein [Thiothrix caldifontis]SEA41974.1 Polysaccharide deacetylase [Thiothrix caldifontis]
MKGLFSKLTVICLSAMLLAINSQAATNQPGIVLTFDDTSTGLWHNFFAGRTDNVRATFFVSQWHTLSAAQIQQLRDLQNHGHEIGCHSRNHIGVGQYLFDPNRTLEYVNTEVIPAIRNMNNDGFYPLSFSYPSGERNENYDAAIRPYLPYLRTTYYDPARPLAQNDQIYHNSDKVYAVLAGASLDNRYGVTIAEIEQALIRAKNNHEIISLYGHYIFDDASGDADSQYAIRASKLNQIIAIAQRLGLRFYTFHEAFEVQNQLIPLPVSSAGSVNNTGTATAPPDAIPQTNNNNGGGGSFHLSYLLLVFALKVRQSFKKTITI